MSVFGSLFTAVSGLTAQSQSLGMISNNIANVSTVGYKRSDASFSDLVTTGGRSTLYTPGSVKATQNQRVSLQGILQQSSSSTDLAMSGNGFFVVQNGTGAGAENLYTRAGSFSEDVDGNLRNTGGFILQGWPLDQNGAIVGGASIGSLVPVNLTSGGISQMTTSVSLDANLNAAQAVSTSASDFTRDITIYDDGGNPRTISVSFKKHAPTAGTVTGTVDLRAQTGNFAPGTDSFDVDAGFGATTINLDGNVNKLLTDLNAVPGINAQLDSNGFLVIQNEVALSEVTLTDGSGTPLALNTLGVPAGTTVTTSATPVTGAAPVTENPNGWWDIQVTTATGDLLPTGQSINFNSDGTLNAPVATDGTVNLGLGPVSWTTPAGTSAAFNLDIAGLTQQTGAYTAQADQNGSPVGYRTGVSVSRDGIVSAQFSNGLSRQVYQLGIANFVNPDGLSALTGTVFRVSDTSGDPDVVAANTGGAGYIEGGALEQSNVDLADEFSKMIITQRAYSANTKVITTADQMTAELLQLR